MQIHNEKRSFVLLKLIKLKRILYRLIFLVSVLRYKGYRELITLKLNKRYPVVDLGANTGQSSIILWFRGFEVYAYEPHPIAFEKLNTLFKDVKMIHTINAAVVESESCENEEKKLYLHEDRDNIDIDLSQASSLMIDKTNIDNNDYYRIKTLKLNKIIEDLEKISLVKCDIEGYEYILYKDLLFNKDKIEYFIIETHSKKNPQWKHKDIELKKAFSKYLSKDRYNLDWH
tara:strand:+ start:796 stop:1485 length:690 start_codon:yes stop_codon:yes gene_type:complete